MKISYNWLKDYLNTELSADEAAKLLTSCGLEVEEISKFESVPGGLANVIIGQVLEKEKHPDADKLSVTKVNIGTEILQIVCGAPNVDAGQKVVVALAGADLTFSNGDKVSIKKSKIRGVESNGMICAEDELGLGESHAGIMVLPESTMVGTPAADYFHIVNDQIFDINLTPNRGDAFHHIGVARDLNAVLMQRNGMASTFHAPDLSAIKTSAKLSPIDVKIETEKCLRYSAVSIENIEVKASPEWLQNRLKSIGIKPKNNIVDITTFIMFEYGQPLHAFDADKIANNKIIVKHESDQTPFITLDGNEVKLSETDIMICDENKALCIAGIYGGLESGISNETKNIFIESAYFDPTTIRKTASRLNLRTDAAMHFEKGTDPNITIEALKRAIQLIAEVANASITSEIIDIYPQPISKKSIEITYKNIDRLIGKVIEREKIISILNALDIETENKTEWGCTVYVPTSKSDVTREADIVEEILRMYGFDQIDISLDLYSSVTYSDKINKNKIEDKTATFLTSNGFFEMMTNPVSNSGFYPMENNSLVRLANSMSSELDSMRQQMLFGALESIAYNLNRKNNKLRFFEFGSTYSVNENKKYDQQQHLMLYMSGWYQEKSWLEEAAKASFFHIKSFTEKTLACLGIEDCMVSEINDANTEYGIQLNFRNKPIAFIQAASKKLLKQFDIKEELYYADIDWDYVLKIQVTHKIKYKPVSKFPSVKRDLALLVDEEISYEKIRSIAQKLLKKQILTLQLFDVYKGDKIAQGKKSMAVSFTLADETKTLTDTEIEKMMDQLILLFEKELGAEIRK